LLFVAKRRQTIRTVKGHGDDERGQRDPGLRLVSGLCRELAKLGLNVGMSDARPAVVIRIGLVNRPLWITVDASGEFFE
jgi:hypothetical protein